MEYASEHLKLQGRFGPKMGNVGRSGHRDGKTEIHVPARPGEMRRLSSSCSAVVRIESQNEIVRGEVLPA
jgi:hypothetical protein